MSVPVVRLKIRVRLSDGSRQFLDPVSTANGKLKPLYAVVNGQPEHHPEGVYHLRYLKGKKRVWEAVGSDPQLALTRKLQKQKFLEAKAAGVAVVDEGEKQLGSQRLLTGAVAEYLAETKEHKSQKTLAAYTETLDTFCEAMARKHLKDDSSAGAYSRGHSGSSEADLHRRDYSRRCPRIHLIPPQAGKRSAHRQESSGLFPDIPPSLRSPFPAER